MHLTPLLLLSSLFISVVSSSDTEVTLNQINPGQKINYRDPKFLSFIKKLLQPKPEKTGDYSQKYGEAITNYNEYQNLPDPYNQNQYLTSAFGTPNVASNSASSSGTSTSGINGINDLFTKLGLLGDESPSTSSVVSNILSLGTGSMEGVLNRVNKFDSLKCIPRLLCQTIARRQQDAATTTTTMAKPKGYGRDGKFIKFQGVDTALEQFVTFLDLVQLKDWSLYPYFKGAYEGSQVKRWDECGSRFASCPFSDEQLVYYFNNYNGGFFQSFRSD